jgi:hypothetical protein
VFHDFLIIFVTFITLVLVEIAVVVFNGVKGYSQRQLMESNKISTSMCTLLCFSCMVPAFLMHIAIEELCWTNITASEGPNHSYVEPCKWRLIPIGMSRRSSAMPVSHGREFVHERPQALVPELRKRIRGDDK